MKPATRHMLRRHGWRVDRMVHNYLYFLYYYPYVKIVYHAFAALSRYFAWFTPLVPVIRAAFDRYHAKVLSYPDAVKFFTIDEDVSIVSEANKQIIPYKYAHDIILKEPDFLAVMDCPCKLTLGAPLWAVSSCISVGGATSRFWLEKCGAKYHARKIRQAEALDILERFRNQGYLTQAFFKVATGGCTGVICNCHIDNCVSLQATQFARRFDPSLSMQAASGYSVLRADGRCVACGKCETICMFGAIATGGQSRWQYDRAACMGCGLCTEHCPEQALSLYPDAEKTLPLDLERVREGRQIAEQ